MFARRSIPAALTTMGNPSETCTPRRMEAFLEDRVLTRMAGRQDRSARTVADARAHREGPRRPARPRWSSWARPSARGRGRKGRLVHQRMGRLVTERLARHRHFTYAGHLRAGPHVGSPGPPRHRQGHVDDGCELRLDASAGRTDPQLREVRRASTPPAWV